MTVVDRPDVRTAVERSADPLGARAALARLLDAHPDLGAAIEADDTLRDALIALSVASHSLFMVLERDPRAIAMLHADALNTPIGTDETPDVSGPDPAQQLRQWKNRQMVRVAARDLLGVSTLRDVGAELAALAQTCLECALAIAGPPMPMSIIGMGKLGGEELNYSSDVDVMFVHAGDGVVAEAEHAARTVLRVMSEPSADGIVFRTDAALRPEGRAGALSRTLEAYEHYWNGWAQTWELQALIKARLVAGDADLGASFLDRRARYVWPDVLDPDAVREVHAMKARSEELVRQKGTAERELKRGYGGIRDIEFAVQLLQLVHGRADANVPRARHLGRARAAGRGRLRVHP